MNINKLLSIAGLAFALTISAVGVVHATPFNLGQWKQDFDNHCTTHGLSVSCSVSKESSVVVTIPGTTETVLVTPAGPPKEGNHGDGICPPFQFNNPIGGKQNCQAISALDIAGNGGSSPVYTDVTNPDSSVTNYSCTTKTGSLTLVPFNVSVDTSTKSGKC